MWAKKRRSGVKARQTKMWVAFLLLCGLLATPVITHAVTLISQGYLIDDSPASGSIVSLQKDSANKVETTTVSNVNNIVGVVIGSGGSQLTISTEGKNQVQVATNGVQQVLVSDINGKISAGDQITASPISGVGMLATTSTKVVGVAQGDFPNSSASQQSYTDKNKQKQTVKIGEIPVLVNVAYFYKQPDKTLIPPALQNIANALAGKAVNTVPILISIGIFVVTLIVVVSIIYALIHSSIISVGRNPLSQSAVYRNVIQLSLLVVIILVVSIVAIYMVLRKF